MPIRLSGMASGLDTEAIVGALVSAYSYKKDKIVKAQTKLSWTQDAWKTLNSKVYNLYNEIGTYRYSDAYAMKKTTVSDSTKAKITASGTAVNGTQSLKINKLAKAGYLTSAKLDDNVTGDTKLVNLGYSLKGAKGSIQVMVGTETKTFNVTKDTTVDEFVNELNKAGVTASFDETNKRIFVSSSASGASNNFSISGSNQAGIEALSSLGLMTSSSISSYADSLFKRTTDDDGNVTGIVPGLSGLTSIDATYTIEDGKAKISAISYDVGETYNTVKSKLSTIRGALYTLSDKNATEDEKKAANTVIKENSDWLEFVGLTSDEWLSSTADEVINNAMSKIDSAVKMETMNSKATLTTSNNTFSSLADLAEYTTVAGTKYYDSSATEALMKSLTDQLSELRNYNVKDESGNYTEKAVAAQEKIKTLYKALQSGASDDEISAAKTSLGEKEFALYQQMVTKYTSMMVPDPDDLDGSSFAAHSNADIEKMGENVLGDIERAAAITYGQMDIDTSYVGTKVEGSDAEIELNGVTFTSSSNSITINGLTIEALGVTDSDLSITTSTDTSGLYDKVKNFLTEYNNLINEMMKLYNAESASDYEPLTDDEKAEMSESEIEKWEQKIKDSLLRRDPILSSLITGMSTAMMSVFEIGGEKVSWSTFGVGTLGFLNAEKNQNYAYHIDGDSEDSKTSGKEDKLSAALASDPDKVIEFLKQVSSSVYSALNSKMSSTAVSSVFTVYNDKEMASEYSDYTSQIKTWTTRVSDMEDAYYKKFSAMEKALAKLQGTNSSISSLLGQ